MPDTSEPCLLPVVVPATVSELIDQTGGSWIRQQPGPNKTLVALDAFDLGYLAGRHCHGASVAAAANDTGRLAYHAIAAQQFDQLARGLATPAEALGPAVPAMTVLDPRGIDQHGRQWVPSLLNGCLGVHLSVAEILELRKAYAATLAAAYRLDPQAWASIEVRRSLLLTYAAQLNPDVMALAQRPDHELAEGVC